MQCFIIQRLLSGIQLLMSEEKISVMLNNCVAWSAEEFVTRFAEVCADFLATKRFRFTTLLSDGFGFLLFDGENVVRGVVRLRNRSTINDKKLRNSFARWQLQTRLSN